MARRRERLVVARAGRGSFRRGRPGSNAFGSGSREPGQIHVNAASRERQTSAREPRRGYEATHGWVASPVSTERELPPSQGGALSCRLTPTARASTRRWGVVLCVLPVGRRSLRQGGSPGARRREQIQYNRKPGLSCIQFHSGRINRNGMQPDHSSRTIETRTARGEGLRKSENTRY